MAIGGNFLTHNKILPGAYINFVSKARALGGLSERGVVAFAMKNNWGEEEKVITIFAEDFEKKALEIFGYEYTSEKLKPIREIFKNAREIKFFRLGTGTKATATIDELTITALYNGTRGNDIKIKISKGLEQKFTVFTYLKDKLVDEQTVSNISELKDNKFVTFAGEGVLNSNNAGQSLLTGTDLDARNIDYSKFLEKIEAENFNVLIYDGEDDTTKGLFTNFTKRLRDDEGIKITTVLHNYTKADYEGIISLKNEKELLYWLAGALAGAEINESITNKKYDGEYEFDAKFSNYEGIISLKNEKELLYWLAGALAGAEINESITNKKYDGEYEFDAKFSNATLKEAIKNGEILFYSDCGEKKILKDINTFTSFSSDKNSDFSNNQIIRILDSTANDIARIFNEFYLGKMQNDELGRDIFKAEVISYFRQLQSIRAIDNFDDKDISIAKGTEKGDIILDVLIEPVSCMDKLYMKCIIE